MYHFIALGCNTFLTSSSGTFQSPNYPSDYPNMVDCWYRISVSAGKVIKLRISSFNLEYHLTCGYDKLAIYDGSGTSATILATLCGILYNVTEFKSSGSDMYVRFTTDGSVTRSGFQANYSEVVAPSGGNFALFFFQFAVIFFHNSSYFIEMGQITEILIFKYIKVSIIIHCVSS